MCRGRFTNSNLVQIFSMFKALIAVAYNVHDVDDFQEKFSIPYELGSRGGHISAFSTFTAPTIVQINIHTFYCKASNKIHVNCAGRYSRRLLVKRNLSF